LNPPGGDGRSSRVVRADQLPPGVPTRPWAAAAAACLLALAGCQSFLGGPPAPKPLDPPAAAAGPVAADYSVCFPDVLELDIAGRPDCSGMRLVYPDGRLDLGPAGAVFAEGCTATELTRRVADAVGVPAQHVRCRVAAARSRVVYVVGAGRSRAVPYRGPERATDLLRRAGGLPADGDVRVVRRNVARGAATETFRVDLAAVRGGDTRTDVILQPNDEVRVEDAGVGLAAFVP
jgi:protein involved in polysaccharide export with SLBB domain